MNTGLIKRLAKEIVELNGEFGYTASSREVSQEVWQAIPQATRTQIVSTRDLTRSSMAANYAAVLDYVTSIWA
jgi:hypothetical protein